MTNLVTGESIRANISGPLRLVYDATGNFLRGHNTGASLSFGFQPGLSLKIGRTNLATGVFHGRTVDLCARLSE